MRVRYDAPKNGRLAGQVAVVTGGTKGIGEAIVRRFADEGAKIVITGRSEDEGAAIAHEIKAAGGSAAFHYADLDDFDTIRDSFDFAARTFGKITCLVNNANPGNYGGIAGGGLQGVENESIARWEGFLRQSLTGAAFVPIHYGVPHLVRAGGGTIIQISSIAALRAETGTCTYSAGKAAQNNLIMNAGHQLAEHGIRANAIACGFIHTPTAVPVTRDNPVTAAHFEKMIPWGIGHPADIANVALFLACDESRYITGQTITADGGWTGYLPGLTEEMSAPLYDKSQAA